MFLMLSGVVGRVFENNQAHVFASYRSKLDRRHAIRVFFKLFVK